jgi:hypothetical protein
MMPKRASLIRAVFDAAPQAAQKKSGGKFPLRHALEHGAPDDIIELLKAAYPAADGQMFGDGDLDIRVSNPDLSPGK